jgi:hypothetical protein
MMTTQTKKLTKSQAKKQRIARIFELTKKLVRKVVDAERPAPMGHCFVYINVEIDGLTYARTLAASGCSNDLYGMCERIKAQVPGVVNVDIVMD